MLIIVKTEILKQKLKTALKEYDDKYEELVVLYRKKVKEYIKALDKEVEQIASGHKLKITISAPYLKTNTRHVIVKALKAVEIHSGNTLELTDSEYNNIISTIENEVIGLTTSYNNLGGTAYGGNL